MSTKLDNESLAKAGDDEPIFVLRPTDMLAPMIVNYWIKLASHVLGAEHTKIKEAKAQLTSMIEWQGKNALFVKHPD